MKAMFMLLLVTLSTAQTVAAQDTKDPRYLLVVQGEMPLYPALAKAARVSGDVQVVVTVRNGEVVDARATSGNPLLASPTTANVRTWKFYKTVDATFTTTFSYRLEKK
jgi:outer membrane biosynthesis protein TonB